MVATIPAPYAADVARKRPAYNSEEPIPGSLGDYVRRRRLDLSMSQQDLADRMVDHNAKVDQSDISKLEVPGTKLPRPPRMRALALALNVSIGRLYKEAGFPDHADIGAALAEDAPIYDATFEELIPFTDEELRRIRALKAELQAARDEAIRRRQPPRPIPEPRSEADEREATG